VASSKRCNHFGLRIQVKGAQREAWLNKTGRLQNFIFSSHHGYFVVKINGKTPLSLFEVWHDTQAALIDIRWQMNAFEQGVWH